MHSSNKKTKFHGNDVTTRRHAIDTIGISSTTPTTPTTMTGNKDGSHKATEVQREVVTAQKRKRNALK
jgi:hypothetical protein